MARRFDLRRRLELLAATKLGDASAERIPRRQPCRLRCSEGHSEDAVVVELRRSERIDLDRWWEREGGKRRILANRNLHAWRRCSPRVPNHRCLTGIV